MLYSSYIKLLLEPSCTPDVMVIPQVYMLVGSRGQGPGFKSPRGTFTYIYT